MLHNDDGNKNGIHRKYYSLLNIPVDADLGHVQRNFKLLSRVYHPDKSIDGDQNVAQESFVNIKTAVDVLSDPIYRLAYDFGDELAVTIIKRSQAVRRQKQAYNKSNMSNQQYDEKRDSNEETVPNDDLYTILDCASDVDEATSILQEALENYHRQRQNQNNMAMSTLDLSCSVPLIWKEVNKYSKDNYLQKESVSLNAHGRYPLNSRLGLSIGAASDVKHTAEANMKGSLGFNYQHVSGTNVHTNVTCNHRSVTSPDISISTSRKCIDESVLVAAINGNVSKANSWYASFISSRPILYETIFGTSYNQTNKSTSKSNQKRKLMMNWRIICDTVGRLRVFMTSLHTMDYPMWKCRLSSSNYHVKLSWCGAVTDTFYITFSFGLYNFARVKVVRLSSLPYLGGEDKPWKFKYGLKYDSRAMFTNGSMWSILCSLHGNEIHLRLPIRLVSTSPVMWIGSFLIAEFVDQRLSEIRWNVTEGSDSEVKHELAPNYSISSSDNISFMTPVPLHIIRNVAEKKRQFEAQNANGLVITQAKLMFAKSRKLYDITDTLQFWVVDGTLHLSSLSDPRLLWQIDDIPYAIHDKEDEVEALSWWKRMFWNHNGLHSKMKRMESVSSLDIRYQHKGMTYQISYHVSDDQNGTIQLPCVNATELGPSTRVR
jgi:curved DNA-binding protein CbpA